MYEQFDCLQLRRDLEIYAQKTSYRLIENETGGLLKRSKIGRIINDQAELSIKDAELILNLLNKRFDDYVKIYML